MDLVEGEVWDAVLEAVSGLASVAVLLPGLTLVEVEEDCHDAVTSSVVRGPLLPGHISKPRTPSMEKHHLLLVKYHLTRK
jgi:hypothetical protein